MKWNGPFKGLSVTLGHEFFISTLYSNPIIFSMCTYLMKISAIGGLEKSRILAGLLPQVSSLDRTFENRILERSNQDQTLDFTLVCR